MATREFAPQQAPRLTIRSDLTHGHSMARVHVTLGAYGEQKLVTFGLTPKEAKMFARMLMESVEDCK